MSKSASFLHPGNFGVKYSAVEQEKICFNGTHLFWKKAPVDEWINFPSLFCSIYDDNC